MRFVLVLVVLFLLAGTGVKSGDQQAKKKVSPEAIKVEDELEALVTGMLKTIGLQSNRDHQIKTVIKKVIY